ncbi:MAG: transposase, partial [Acidobacteria bacterium]|nr:transposase [Acidobacteriota bacterium]
QRLWFTTTEIRATSSHPFYDRLNQLLDSNQFDLFVEGLCQRFYEDSPYGRPSITPGIYFRCLLLGYFEGIDSERGVAWRTEDSLSLRKFLGIALDESTPDHSTISRTRRLIDVETHQKVFQWVLELVAKEGLLKGNTIGIDATTLEANAALRSIVRRENGESYNEFLTKLAQASGIETPTREQLAQMDKKRKKRMSNDEWMNPHDPDAKITKMKDGSTHLAHKAEHAVDMQTGALVAVTVQGADLGDTTTYVETLVQAGVQIAEVAEVVNSEEAGAVVNPEGPAEVVTDKGYHSNEVLRDLKEVGVRSYIPEPDRGKRKWEGKAAEQAAVYGNRRRIRGVRGKRLLKQRGEKLERSFAHMYETGGMRRTHLRGHENILKRLVVHGGAFNLALILRNRFGIGKPRRLQGVGSGSLALFVRLLAAKLAHWAAQLRFGLTKFLGRPQLVDSFALVGYRALACRPEKTLTFATGC